MKALLLVLALLTDAAPATVVRPLDLATVCATKWGVDHRRVTAAMKTAVAQRAGIPPSAWPLYVFDHIVPRELAGADVAENLQMQLKADAHVKDRRENALHRAVCQPGSTVTLADAQLEMWTHWRTGS